MTVALVLLASWARTWTSEVLTLDVKLRDASLRQQKWPPILKKTCTVSAFEDAIGFVET